MKTPSPKKECRCTDGVSDHMVHKKGCGHTTHHACEEVMERDGGKAVGCCCTGHKCKEQNTLEERLSDVLENGNIPIGSRSWRVRQEQVIKDLKSFIRTVEKEAEEKGYAEATVGQSINLSVPNSKTRRGRVSDVAQTIDTGMQQHTLTEDCRIRRLTPLECERLQGFPDNWTEGFSDTQRYKMCGNAVTVNVVREIMKRLLTPSLPITQRV